MPSPETSLGEQIVTQARSYLGAPWFHAGRSREGLDCIGLLAVVAHDLSLTQYDDRSYAPDPPSERLTSTLRTFCAVVPTGWYTHPGALKELEPGDILQFTIKGDPRHCAIFARADGSTGDPLDSPTIIHAYQSAGMVMEQLFDEHWQRRLYRAYRWRGEG